MSSSESSTPREVSPHEDPRPVSGDELLPPVEEPSAGFLVQLFVIPALIVLVIVSIWVTFNWLVHRTTMGPEKLVQGLEEGPAIARWQRASELADRLRDERYADFKRDSGAALQLARILDREIDRADTAGGMTEEDVTLRYFLTRALGEFEVNEGVDVLLKAATTARDPAELIVRRGAIQAIAVRAYHLRQLGAPLELRHSELEPTLLRLAQDSEPLVRSETAFALGKLGTPAAVERLEVMVDDPHADTRYNAAIALGHQGNPRAVETLAEMLDLEEPASVREELHERSQAMKRAVIFSNALDAVDALADETPDADFSLVIESLERVAAADTQTLAKARIPGRLAGEGKRVLDTLRQNHATSNAAD